MRYSSLSNKRAGCNNHAGLKIDKHAECNKTMQVGIFQKSIVEKSILLGNFLKLIYVQDAIRPCRLENSKKINKNVLQVY